ncbi:MAG: sugar ABC transporter ATP-binding protein [Chloroflexi bacterium]|nr:sugar ABC transporter ATP-binding protein [Chloroflexota bacterium]MCC6891742.1 sugar ABC transporter ATP-binding protein [Anaerolineae bacterium]
MIQPNKEAPILEMRGITKRFPGMIALNGVDFSARRGEIHALIGQNGAGKSTLMKILAGVYPLEEGELRIQGESMRFSHPRDALRIGIGTVYQDLSLVPQLSVAHNIFLGREAGNGIFINQKADRERSAQILTQLGIQSIDVDALVSDLPLAQQQLVEIAKVISHQPKILVLDEPTAALADEESTLLFKMLEGLKAQQIAIIFISHRFKEILKYCDHATVLRNGQLVKTFAMQGVSEDELVEMTIGERKETFFQQREQNATSEEIVLEVENLSVGRSVKKVSFSLKRGEIVGITGLLGAGQNELVRALFGTELEVSGLIRRKGKAVFIGSPKQAIALGIGLLTEHRKAEGLIVDMSVKENITLPSLALLFRQALLFIRNRSETQAANDSIRDLQIKVGSAHAAVGTLSGGNQQKVILAKWLMRDLDILMFIAPTQGIDVGAKAEIYRQLHVLAEAGKSIMVVSEDLIEILGISDRIFIMYDGQLSQTIDRAEASEEGLLSATQGYAHVE